MKRLCHIVLAAALIALQGCANFAAPACHEGQHRAEVAQLLFGRNIGKELGVSDADWIDFLTRELSPRFPDGLTVYDANGQWRDPAGNMVQESSKVVMIVLSGSAEEKSRLDATIQAYKGRFHQRSVGLVIETACVSF